jgi:gliding motility-associated-like protein
MQIGLKNVSLSFRSIKSVQLFVLIAVCGILNIKASTLSADDLRAHPGSIVFKAVQGHALNDTRSVFIFAALGSTMNWSDSKDVSWLTLNLQNGVTDGVLEVGVNTTGMISGIYNGNITLSSAQSVAGPVIIPVTLVINPDVPVQITTWKDGYGSAMSVSVDDGQSSGFDVLQSNGFSGTYVCIGTVPPSFYTDYYNAGMELGSHTVNHHCADVSDNALRSQELEPNILGICTNTPEPCTDVITFVWPCGYTNYHEQAVTTEYFLSSRGYNINQLEDATPDNFMNLKSYNSHEDTPYPPSDLKTVVDAAVSQGKWFNLILHTMTNDDGAINYAASKDIWVTSIGNVIKYILQRDRFILTNYNAGTNMITYNVSRLQIPSSVYRSFENAFGPNDKITMQIDIDDSRTIVQVVIDGVVSSYQIKDLNGNKVLLADVKLDPTKTKSVEIDYQNLSPYTLTISGVTANSKVYNGTTAATLNTGSATLNGVITGDNVTLISVGATGTFVNKNAGNSKSVTTSGFVLGGTDAGKYTLIQPALSANITKASLTVTGVTANNKVYDGTTVATLNTGSATLAGVISGDVVSLVSTGATGTFVNKNVGTGKSVSISGLTPGGADGGNYTLTQPSATANITKAGLTVSGVTANNKVYDGTAAATLNTGGAGLVGVFGGDAVTLISTGVTGTFSNKNVGTGKVVTMSGFSIGGSDAANYTLTQPTATANITGIIITVTGVTANNKVYNGSTAATLNTGIAAIAGVLGGDVVTLITTGATGTFANKNVGTGKVVSTSGFSLGGNDAANYTLTQPTATANITIASLTVSGVTVNNKVYDGTSVATLNTGSTTLAGVISGDVVSLVSTGATGTFVDKSVGTGKSVSISGLTLGGADGANYALTQPTATANITKAGLTVSGVTANNKVYDRITAATLNTGSAGLVGVFGGDAVTLISTGVTGTFSNKNVGTGKVVTMSGFSIGGSDAANYTLTQPTTTANITGIIITVTGVTANNKVYNGSTAATLNTGIAAIAGVLGGDVVTLITTGATGTFVNKNVGTGKVVSTSGLSLGGNDAANYTLTQPTVAADITIASLTVSGVTANNKVYDGTTVATLNAGSVTLHGIFGGDVVNLVSSTATGTFSSKNVGTGKIVSTSGFTLEGTDAGNYTLTQPALIANISAKALTIIANDLTKAYRSSLTFTGSEYKAVGLVSGDTISGITLSSPGADASAVVGTYVISVGGGTNNNYIFTYVSGIMIVNKAILTAKADDKTKVYGSDNPPLTISYTGFIKGENTSVLDALPVVSTTALSTSNAGSYSIVLSGGSDKDYSLILVNGSLNIVKAPLTVTADNKTKVYGAANPDLTITYAGFVLDQDQSVLKILPAAETAANLNSDAGDYDISITEAADSNYNFIYKKGTLNITKADQVIDFAPIPAGLRMTQEYGLHATASSGLVVSFELSDPNIASLNDNILTVQKDGNLTIMAIQEGDHNWNPAPDASQSIVTFPTFDGISSLFTPNNDGMNDYWYISDLEQYGSIEVTVYNRFGQVVYHSNSYKNDWDGKWKGYPLPSASYYYLIKSSAKGFITGVVNIVR